MRRRRWGAYADDLRKVLGAPAVSEVKVLEGRGGWGEALPFMVEVSGEVLRNARGVGRRFKTSAAAAVAGAKEVERRRAIVNGDRND